MVWPLPCSSVTVLRLSQSPGHWSGAWIDKKCRLFGWFWYKVCAPLRMFRPISSFVFVIVVTLSACHSSVREPAARADTPASRRPAMSMFKRNPEVRAHVKKEPVAEYRVRTDNALNEMYFTVRLYETPLTMK